MIRRGALVAALALLAGTVAAQERPNIYPTRDVAVTYRVTSGQGAPPSVTMAWQAATRRMRMDVPGMGWMVADHDANRAFVAMEGARILMDLPMAQAMAQHGPSENARFTRLRTDRVAGLPCTVWRYEDRGQTGEACLTADGVMLRGRGAVPGGGSGAVEATEVRFGPQEASRFARPQGWANMPVPGMPGASPPQR